MLGSVQLGVYQLGQGVAGAIVEPPEPIEVEPDVVHVTAGIRTRVDASARVCQRVEWTAGIVSVVHLRVER